MQTYHNLTEIKRNSNWRAKVIKTYPVHFSWVLDGIIQSTYNSGYEKISFRFWRHYSRQFIWTWCISASTGSEVSCKSTNSCILRLWNSYLELHTVHRRPDQGRRRTKSDVQDSYLMCVEELSATDFLQLGSYQMR